MDLPNLAAGNETQAFRCWESFRTLLWKDGADGCSSTLPSFPPATTLVSFVRLGGRYIGWIVTENGMRRLRSSPDTYLVRDLAAVLASLCATPESHEADIRFVGQKLVSEIFGDDYQDVLGREGALAIETDAGLAQAPFRA